MGYKFMSKNKRKKYYAIKEGKGVKNIIVRSWAECAKLVLGYNSVYKSFLTEEEALSYLNKVDVEKVKDQTKKGIERKKIRKETTRSLNVRLDKKLYDEFVSKCNKIGLSKEQIITSMIKEWIE